MLPCMHVSVMSDIPCPMSAVMTNGQMSRMERLLSDQKEGIQLTSEQIAELQMLEVNPLPQPPAPESIHGMPVQTVCQSPYVSGTQSRSLDGPTCITLCVRSSCIRSSCVSGHPVSGHPMYQVILCIRSSCVAGTQSRSLDGPQRETGIRDDTHRARKRGDSQTRT